MPVPAGSRELLQKAQKGAVGGWGGRQNSIRVCTFLGDKAHLSFLRAPNAPCVGIHRNDVGDWNSPRTPGSSPGLSLGLCAWKLLIKWFCLKILILLF